MSVILDPTDERVPVRRTLAERGGEVSGTVTLLDISKPRGNVLLDRLEELFNEQLPDVEVKRYSKPTFAKPAPEELRQQIKEESDLVVEGLAD
jgi:hypothetical protein